jgi:Fe-S-cluster containining protein
MMQRLSVTPPPNASADDIRFYQLRNGKMSDGRMRMVAQMFVPCVEHDAEKKQCRTYENRPRICKEFPMSPEQIEGTPCSYYFETPEGNRGGQGSPYPTPPRFIDRD